MANSENDYELVWDYVREDGVIRKKLGRSKTTGTVLMEVTLDSREREIEKCFFRDDGSLIERVVYELDEDRKPKVTLVYDTNGKLVRRHKRNCRPEFFDAT